MLPAETAAGPVALLQPSCGNDRQSWDSMHVSPAGCRRDELFKIIKNVVMMLHWAWQGVCRSALMRATSLAFTILH